MRCLAATLLVALLAPTAAAQIPNPFAGPSEYDQRMAREMEPAPLAFFPRPRQRPSRVLRVRFWADNDFRAVTPSWKIKTRAWLSQLSRLLEPSLGVTFEAVGFREWDRPATYGTLAQATEQLAKADPAQDADWVVGLVSALPLMTANFHSVGEARGAPPYFVLRAMGDMNDARAVYANLGKIEASKKEALYSRRILHKELATFLHEWAHTLGARHVGDPQNLMCPTYLPSMRGFSPAQLEALDRALERLRSGGAVDTPDDQGPEPGPAPPTPDATAAQQSASAPLIGARLEKARAAYQAGDRAEASDRLDEAVDLARTVAAPGDSIWVTAAEACLAMGNLRAAEEALRSAGDGDGARRLRARLAELRRAPPPGKRNRPAPRR